MARSPKKYEIEMINGPIFINLIRFAVPIICSTVLKLLFHAADMIVIGRFVGAQALAAIGATGQVYTLLINLFMGFSVGRTWQLQGISVRAKRKTYRKACIHRF